MALSFVRQLKILLYKIWQFSNVGGVIKFHQNSFSLYLFCVEHCELTKMNEKGSITMVYIL